MYRIGIQVCSFRHYLSASLIRSFKKVTWRVRHLCGDRRDKHKMAESEKDTENTGKKFEFVFLRLNLESLRSRTANTHLCCKNRH